MIKLAPSILSADFARLLEDVKKVENAGCEYLHIDVMDGHFVPNITLGPNVVKSLRKDVDMVYEMLIANNIKAERYHAGLNDEERKEAQERFIYDKADVMVATNAFGMGIDKDNVKFVIHLSPSSTLENYYQEIGRAGRNGDEAIAVLLWNDQELTHIDEIFRNQIPSKSEYQKILTYFYSMFQIGDNDLPEKTFSLEIQKLNNLTKLSKAKIRNILSFLHNQELIYHKSSSSASTIQSFVKPEELEQLNPSDAFFLELLFRNLPGLAIQKVYFSDAAFCNKNSFDIQTFKLKLKQMQKAGYLEYLDGGQQAIKFLKPRNDRHLFGEYWQLFNNIQQNKLRKWEENKFYVRDTDFCKMKLILNYFGEADAENCGKCSVCRKRTASKRNLSSEIILQLEKKPMTLDEMSASLHFYQRETVSETIIFLLDIGKVKMLNYKTYMLNQ